MACLPNDAAMTLVLVPSVCVFILQTHNFLHQFSSIISLELYLVPIYYSLSQISSYHKPRVY